jgi:hypothetical protein
MIASPREKVTPFVRTQPGVQKIMITVFFTSTALIVSEAFPKGMKFNQDYFISTVLMGLTKENDDYWEESKDFPSWSIWTIPPAVTIIKSQTN